MERGEIILTYQDYLTANDREAFISRLGPAHEPEEMTKTARIADLYDRQRNATVNEFARKMYSLSGRPIRDFTSSNFRIASGFFSRLNTQRVTYSLGNGVTFSGPDVKEKLGADFDTRLFEAGRLSLIHGVSFLFFNVDRTHVFPLTEFAPLYDEETGALRAGLRYWRVDEKKPLRACLYREDGCVRLRETARGLAPAEEVLPYRLRISAGGEILGGENYPALPVVPLWGSRMRQSTLVGMRQAIDSFDLIRSGFANDLTDCAEIYWLLENYGGMTDDELARFRDRLKLQHIAVLDTGGEGRLTPFAQSVPHEARMAYLSHIRAGLYEDFGALDVAQLSSGRRTATEIEAAYQPMDEQADDFEYQVIEAVQRLLALLGIRDTPLFKRNRVACWQDEAEILLKEAPYLDAETLLFKLPNLTPEEANAVLARRAEKPSPARRADEAAPCTTT